MSPVWCNPAACRRAPRTQPRLLSSARRTLTRRCPPPRLRSRACSSSWLRPTPTLPAMELRLPAALAAWRRVLQLHRTCCTATIRRRPRPPGRSRRRLPSGAGWRRSCKRRRRAGVWVAGRPPAGAVRQSGPGAGAVENSSNLQACLWHLGSQQGCRAHGVCWDDGCPNVNIMCRALGFHAQGTSLNTRPPPPSCPCLRFLCMVMSLPLPPQHRA